MSFDLKKIGTVVNTIKKCIDVAAEAYNTIEKSSESTDVSESTDDLQNDEPLSEYQVPNTEFGGNGAYYPPYGYNGYSNAYAYRQQAYPNGFGTQQQGYPPQTTYQPQQSGYQWSYF